MALILTCGESLLNGDHVSLLQFLLPDNGRHSCERTVESDLVLHCCLHADMPILNKAVRNEAGSELIDLHAAANEYFLKNVSLGEFESDEEFGMVNLVKCAHVSSFCDYRRTRM